MAGQALRPPDPWLIRRLPVCASTEWELERWLRLRAEAPAGLEPLEVRLAVVAARQRHGHGQRGRPWLAPAGGLWLSAAFPWPSDAQASLALALAVGLARQLEGLGLPVRIKWPNDLLLEGRKLAGLLPRLRWRGGQVRWAQAGIGLNGHNRVPPGAVSVGQALAPGRGWHPEASPRRLEAQVLTAIGWALHQAREPERVRAEAERRLWRPDQGVDHGGQRWEVTGLALDGALALHRGAEHITVSRPF